MKKIIYLIALTILLLVGCSQSIEKEIIGTWKNAKTDDDCDTNMNEKITFDKEGNITGIEGFETYKIDINDTDDDYDYAILGGGIEDNARYRIKIDKNKQLNIVYEDEEKYDFESAIACKMEKVSD